MIHREAGGGRAVQPAEIRVRCNSAKCLRVRRIEPQHFEPEVGKEPMLSEGHPATQMDRHERLVDGGTQCVLHGAPL